jgi:hypothetical protein
MKQRVPIFAKCQVCNGASEGDEVAGLESCTIESVAVKTFVTVMMVRVGLAWIAAKIRTGFYDSNYAIFSQDFQAQVLFIN